jgi:hypothetical protein
MACAVGLLCCAFSITAAQQPDVDEMLNSLRRALREKDATLRSRRTGGPQRAKSEQAGESSMRRLQSTDGDGPQLCTSGACRIELTTGVAGWAGAAATSSDPHWAAVSAGSWIGDSDPDRAPSLLVASVSFDLTEPSCASFDLALAADGRVRAATLNGRALVVPSHSHRVTTSQAGRAGLVAARGSGLFAHGRNSLVLTVANDAGALGLYVAGDVQLLCPLNEATVRMTPAHGPVAGGTIVQLTSNVQLYMERWIVCAFGGTNTYASVVDAYAVRCPSPMLRTPTLRGW